MIAWNKWKNVNGNCLPLLEKETFFFLSFFFFLLSLSLAFHVYIYIFFSFSSIYIYSKEIDIEKQAVLSYKQEQYEQGKRESTLLLAVDSVIDQQQ